MKRTIAIANQKGGVGKTTTAINLSSCIAEAGKKTLVIDMDPQGNTTSGLGVDKNAVSNTVYELLLRDCSAKDAIVHTEYEHLDLIPSNVNLTGAEVELISMDDKEYLLKNQLDPVKSSYDFIIIDCPPSLNMLTVNSMSAADSILIPIQCEYYALEGLSQLLSTISLIQERLNENLKVEGIVFTMFDSRTRLSNDVVNNVRSNLDLKIYKTIIPRNVRLAEAPSYGMPITAYDPRSSGARSYEKLAREIIRRRSI